MYLQDGEYKSFLKSIVVTSDVKFNPLIFLSSLSKTKKYSMWKHEQIEVNTSDF